jgi:FKBP12-rapamycin complex-associated protein
LEIALESPSTPPEILTTLLTLAEFMEHEEKPIQFGIKLGEKAEKCHAYAKALYYKEEEFVISPASTVEALISLNNQLGQPSAAIGILKYAQTNHQVELKESWYEKLHNWEEALAAYEAKQKESRDTENLMGQIRSLHALGEWDSLYKISDTTWDTAEDKLRSVIAPYASAAAWNCSNWVGMEKFVDIIPETTIEGGFYRAILDIHNDNYSSALQCTQSC